MPLHILHHNPGQIVTIALETVDSDGYRADSPSLPVIERIIFPALTLASNYPANMTKLDEGLYYSKFTLPTGAASIGTYLVDVDYVDPITMQTKSTVYQIIVTVVAGNFTITTAI